MKFLKLKIFIFSTLLAFFITTCINAAIKTPFENIKIHNKPIYHSEIEFLNVDGKVINLSKYRGKLIILNFWASWCAPCREEMPSLDILKNTNEVSDLMIFPINIEKINIKKAKKFFKNLNIKNLSIFFDSEFKLVKLFSLRGVPTTIILDREGKEFSRIIGSIDFLDKKFIEWISKY